LAVDDERGDALVLEEASTVAKITVYQPRRRRW
jgi:hypothetical protein